MEFKHSFGPLVPALYIRGSVCATLRGVRSRISTLCVSVCLHSCCWANHIFHSCILAITRATPREFWETQRVVWLSGCPVMSVTHWPSDSQTSALLCLCWALRYYPSLWTPSSRIRSLLGQETRDRIHFQALSLFTCTGKGVITKESRPPRFICTINTALKYWIF